MPQVYGKAVFQMAADRLSDFSLYTPNVVRIALSTIDFSHGDGKKERPLSDGAKFLDAYVDLVQVVKQKYPTARIALLGSPMIGEAGTLLKNRLATVEAKVDAQNSSTQPMVLF